MEWPEVSQHLIKGCFATESSNLEGLYECLYVVEDDTPTYI